MGSVASTRRQFETGNGSPAEDVTATGNVADMLNTTTSSNSVFGESGVLAADTSSLCLDFGGAGALSNNIANDQKVSTEIRLRHKQATQTFSVAGLAGTDSTGSTVNTTISGRNTVNGGTVSSTNDVGGSFTGVTSCAAPPAIPARPHVRRALANTHASHAGLRRASPARRIVSGRVRRGSTITAGSPVAIGVVPPGYTVTFTFSVTVNANIDNPVGATQVVNAGTIAGSNFSDVPISATNPLSLFATMVTGIDQSPSSTSTYGDTVTFTAHVAIDTVATPGATGTPGGTVTFYDGDPGLGGVAFSPPVGLASGQARTVRPRSRPAALLTPCSPSTAETPGSAGARTP